MTELFILSIWLLILGIIGVFIEYFPRGAFAFMVLRVNQAAG